MEMQGAAPTPSFTPCCAHDQVLLDGDGDGFVTVEDLVGAARVLCAYSGPALVAKTNADVGDLLVALALQTCIGSGIHWGMHVSGAVGACEGGWIAGGTPSCMHAT